MFIYFIAYDAQGRIASTGGCQDTDLPLQAHPGLTYIQGTGAESASLQYVAGGIIRMRPACPVTTSVAGRVVTFMGLPLNSVGQVTGDATLTINNTDPSGTNILTFMGPGVYTITVDCFPALDYSGVFALP